MRVIEINASAWAKISDFYDALASAIGAPDGHGRGIDAFIDSMVWHDDMNAVKSPYTIRIVQVAKSPAEVQAQIRLAAQCINEAGMSDRGTDIEVGLKVED